MLQRNWHDVISTVKDVAGVLDVPTPGVEAINCLRLSAAAEAAIVRPALYNRNIISFLAAYISVYFCCTVKLVLSTGCSMQHCV